MKDKWSPRENKRTIDLECFFLSFKITLFEHVLKQISTFTCWCMVIFLDHIWFAPSEKPKAFKTKLLRSRTMNSDHWKRSSSVVRLHGPECKRSSAAAEAESHYKVTEEEHFGDRSRNIHSISNKSGMWPKPWILLVA